MPSNYNVNKNTWNKACANGKHKNTLHDTAFAITQYKLYDRTLKKCYTCPKQTKTWIFNSHKPWYRLCWFRVVRSNNIISTQLISKTPTISMKWNLNRNYVVIEIIDILHRCFEHEVVINSEGSIRYPYFCVYVHGALTDIMFENFILVLNKRKHEYLRVIDHDIVYVGLGSSEATTSYLPNWYRKRRPSLWNETWIEIMLSLRSSTYYIGVSNMRLW